MSLPRGVVAALAALVVLTVLPLQVPAAAEEATASPLTVELTELSPSTIPRKGRLVLAGTVRNDSDEIWSAINVHPFVSRQPITDRDQLAVAAASDPAVEVGNRLYGPGQFASIGDLVPGQSMPFRISLKVKDLHLSAPGVYWIGVHALGEHTTGRDVGGRARTFIPLVPPGTRTAVSVVVPLRERVRRDRVGRLLDTSDWSTTLGDEGRLERIAALLGTAGGARTTLLVDPAVVDAVASVAADNPEVSLGEATPAKPGESPSDSPGASDSDTPSRSEGRLGPADRSNAARWLQQVQEAANQQSVLGLGYADPDVASLARRRPALVTTSAKESAAAFKRLAIDAIPAVAPPSGWLDDGALGKIAPDTMILVSDHAAPRTRSHWRTPGGQDLVFTDAQAADGGPGPSPSLDALALRQRIVADAALRAQEGATSPMVVELPADWDPGPGWQAADFFGGLDLPWLDLTTLDRAPADTTPTFDAALGYPAAERRAEIGLVNVSAARGLAATATVLGQLLRTTNDVRHQLTGAALAAVSVNARRDQSVAREEVLATNQAMRDRLDKVSVVGTDFVTLSGGTGTLTVTLVNQLDQPVTVGIRPTATSPDVHIQTPKPLEMAPGQRAVLRLKARARSIGVHQVTLTPVTAQGSELGTPLTFNLRTSQVGKLIWGVFIGGGALLVVMILRRIRRGLREHRWRGQ